MKEPGRVSPFGDEPPACPGAVKDHVSLRLSTFPGSLDTKKPRIPDISAFVAWLPFISWPCLIFRDPTPKFPWP